MPEQQFSLWYGVGTDARYVMPLHLPSLHTLMSCRQINLSASSVEALDALEAACEAAMFGRNQETVLDESYRKAGKMDVDRFSLAFDAERSGLVDAVKTGILKGEEEEKKVRAELYKLNVYGEFPMIIYVSFRF